MDERTANIIMLLVGIIATPINIALFVREVTNEDRSFIWAGIYGLGAIAGAYFLVSGFGGF